MTACGMRREKAALSRGCKSHPATAPAGSNRSSHGGKKPVPPKTATKRVVVIFRQISTSLWMCARALACGGRCCSRRRSCKRSSRQTARRSRLSASDGGRSGRSIYSKSDSHRKTGRPLAGRQRPRRRRLSCQAAKSLPTRFQQHCGLTPSAAYGKEPRSNRYQVHGCLWR
jgi:hypothetical protein